MVEKIPIERYFKDYASIPIVDVRSPAEFLQGHLPNAVNIPLFTNEERAIVGTCYKKEGKDKAVKLGLEFVGPKLANFVVEAEHIAPNKEIIIHCWRGGMRSGSFAWLLQTAGFKQVLTIELGYKAYRKYVLATLERPLKYNVIGGFTGSHKTTILQMLGESGEQVIDLEQLANHKGSAFGSMGQEKQPTQEQFENNLAMKILNCDENKPVWIEDESRHIGSVGFNNSFFDLKTNAPLFLLELSLEERIDNLVKDYACFPKEEIKESLCKIEKKLGGQHLKTALEALERNDFKKLTSILLVYYDKFYAYSLDKKTEKNMYSIVIQNDKLDEAVEKLIKESRQLWNQ